MLGLLMSGRVAIADSGDDGTASSSTKQMTNEAVKSSTVVRSSAQSVQKGEEKAPVSSFMSMINDYKYKVREDLQAASTVAQLSRKLSSTGSRPKKEEIIPSAVPAKEKTKENTNQTPDSTAQNKNRELSTSAAADNEKVAPLTIQQATPKKTPPLLRVDSVGALDSYLKEPPMYYVGMARIAAVALFKKPEATNRARHDNPECSSNKVEGKSNELTGCQDIKKANEKVTPTSPPRKDQAADAMEFVDKVRSSSASLFSRSKDLDETARGDKPKSKKIVVYRNPKRDEAADLVDKAKNAATSLFSSSDEDDACREGVDCSDEHKAGTEVNDNMIVQTNRQSASLSSISPYLCTSSSRPPRSRTASLDQVYSRASCLRKSSTDSTYVSVSDVYSLTSEEEFVDHGFVMGGTIPIEEEDSDVGSPSSPPKARCNSVDSGRLSSSRFNMTKEGFGDKRDGRLLDGRLAKAALSLLSSRSGSDKDLSVKSESGMTLNPTTPEKERHSFTSFMSSMSSKNSEDDDASCDTMETPKKKVFVSGGSDSDSLFQGLSPKFAAMFQSRETEKAEIRAEEKQSRPEDVLGQIRTYVKAFSTKEGPDRLCREMNDKFKVHFTDNASYLEALSGYYASRPELLKYTLEKELHRMSYEVRVRDEDFGCDIMLTTKDEICEFLRTPKEKRADGKTTEEMAVVDYLFRAANQSLLADSVEVMLQGDSIGPRIMRSVRVHEANFFIDAIDGLVRCDADLRVLLPTDDFSSDGDESLSSLRSGSSSTSTQMELSRIKLSVTFALGTLEDGTKSHTTGRLESCVHEIKLNDMHQRNSGLFDAKIQSAAKMISECAGPEAATQ